MISAYLCDVGVKFGKAATWEIILWKESELTSTNSAANFPGNQFSRKISNTYIYISRESIDTYIYMQLQQ